MIFGTYCKPDFYWRSEQVLRVRRWLGDRGASIFYYSLGGSIFALGIVALGW